MSFLTSPEGNVYATSRIGGAKAVDGGFVLLGTGVGNDRVLEYIETPTAVAIAWRNALSQTLTASHNDRRLPKIDWVGLAAEIDRPWATQWAAKQGLSEPKVSAPTPRPTRRDTSAQDA